MKRKKSLSHNPQLYLLIVLFACAALLTTFKIKTFTIWGSLLNGQLWLKSPSLQSVDHITSTQAGLPITNPQWLGEIIFALAYQFGGFTGVIIFKTIIILAILGLFWKYMREKEANTLVIFWIGLATIFVSHFRFTAGPHIISYLALLFLWTRLQDFKNGRITRLWHLIPFMLLWTNIHFGSVIGLMVMATFVIAAFLARKWPYLFDGNLIYPVDGGMLKHLSLIFVLCVCACLMNPSGVGFLTYPLETMYLAIKYRVMDFYPPRMFPYALLPVFWCLLAFYVVVVFGMIRRFDIFDMLVFLLGAALALKVVNMIPVFAILSAPIITHYLSLLINEGNWPNLLKKITRNQMFTAALSLTLVCIFIVSRGGPRSDYQFGFGVNRHLLPLGVVQFLQSNKIEGNILNEMDWGGFLAHQLHPNNKVFMNNRIDTMGDAFFEIYFELIAGRPGWDATLRSQHIDIVVMSKKLASRAPLTIGLTASRQWHLVYKDDQSLVYIRDRKDLRDIIQIFRYKTAIERKQKRKEENGNAIPWDNTK